MPKPPNRRSGYPFHGRTSEYRGSLVYLYSSPTKIVVANKDYPISFQQGNPAEVQCVNCQDKIFVAIDQSPNSLTNVPAVFQVILGRKDVTKNLSFIPPSDGNIQHNGYLVALKDGSMLYCWYYYVPNEWGFNLRFALRSPAGIWTSSPAIHLSASSMYGEQMYLNYNHVVMAQDQYGGIWCFSQCDGTSRIATVHLSVVNGALIVDWANSDYIIGCEGEFPYLSAIPFEDGVAIAYENSIYNIFSVSPFVKGAQISVVKVSQNLSTPASLWDIPQYVERLSVLGIGLNASGLWVAYQPINVSNLSYPKLSVSSANGTVRDIEPSINLNSLAFSSTKIVYSQPSMIIVEKTV